MRVTLKNKLTFDGQKSGEIQGSGDSEKCFEANTNFHTGKEWRILSSY